MTFVSLLDGRVARRALRAAGAAVLLFGASSAAAQSTTAESSPAAATPPAQEAAPAPPARPWPLPYYAERRFDENWQPNDWANPHAGARDIFDKIKAIPLNESGSAWLSLGGILRGRMAYQSTVAYGGPFDFEPTMWTGRARAHADLHLSKFRVFGEYIYSYSSIEALVDTFGAPEARLGFDAPNAEGDILNLFGEYQGGFGGGWQGAVWGGRRELLMGNQRILSPGNWLLNRHTFDGGGAWVSKGNHRFEGFVTRPRVPIPDRFTRRDDETILSGVFYTTAFVKPAPGGGQRRISFEPYVLNIDRKDVEFVQGIADENRWTMGLLTQGDVGNTGFDFEIEGAYQYGRYETPFHRGIINAYAWASRLGYRFRTLPLLPRASVQLDYSSGDDDPLDESLETFDPLYPLAWNFYGFHAAFDRKNLVVGGVTLDGMYKNVFWRTTYFPVMRRAQVNDGLYNSFNEIARRPDFQSRGGDTEDLPFASNNLGQQVDFGVYWQASHHWSFYGTYLHFFGGDFLRQTQTASVRDMNGVMLLTQFIF
jgi:hypothetical protein